MARRMPVLRHHDVGEAFCDPIDYGNDLLAVFNGQAAAGQETVLDIDHKKGGSVIDFDGSCRPSLP
jgi:hypothetical protein